MLKNIKKFFLERKIINFIATNKLENAEILLRKQEANNPQDMGTIHNLGIVLIGLKKYEEALIYLKKEIKLYGDSYIRYRALGDLYFQWNKQKDAHESYKKTLMLLTKEKADDAEINYLEKRIDISSDKEKYKKAVSSFFQFESANELYNNNEYEKALMDYQKVVLNDSSNFLAYNAIGVIFLNNYSDIENAEKAFLKAKELSGLPVIEKNIALLNIKKQEQKNEKK